MKHPRLLMLLCSFAIIIWAYNITDDWYDVIGIIIIYFISICMMAIYKENFEEKRNEGNNDTEK